MKKILAAIMEECARIDRQRDRWMDWWTGPVPIFPDSATAEWNNNRQLSNVARWTKMQHTIFNYYIIRLENGLYLIYSYFDLHIISQVCIYKRSLAYCHFDRLDLGRCIMSIILTVILGRLLFRSWWFVCKLVSTWSKLAIVPYVWRGYSITQVIDLRALSFGWSYNIAILICGSFGS